MACGCSSSPVTYSSSSVVSNGCGVPTCNCNLPRRSSTPPVVPVLWKDAARFRQMSAGVMIVHCGEEMGSLDSPVSGTVMFDSGTQKVYVSGNSVEYIVDYFGCQTEAIYGFPLYGAKPECRDMGENPDRRIAVVRPPNSAYGIVYGHEQTCAPLTGLRPEITPVQIVPDAFPEIPPTGLQSFTWVHIPAGEDCSGAKRHYYQTPGEHISSVDQLNIRNWAWPDEPVDESHDGEYGMAAWSYNTTATKWELQKVTNASLAKLIEVVVPPYKGLVHQSPWYSIGLVTPSLTSPELLLTFDPTALPGYLPEYKTMWLQTRLIASSHGEDYRIEINIGAQSIHNGIVREEAATTSGLTVDFINPTYVFPFPVTPGNLQVIKYVTTLGGHESVSPLEMSYELKLVGWQQ